MFKIHNKIITGETYVINKTQYMEGNVEAQILTWIKRKC
jgi:hypothetical protein